jgi:predicted metal-dependent phosphotriesterase family hydrolase
MSQVATVGGPVDSADLGPTYMHEHIFVLTADVRQNYPGEWGSEDERITDAVNLLRPVIRSRSRRRTSADSRATQGGVYR